MNEPRESAAAWRAGTNESRSSEGTRNVTVEMLTPPRIVPVLGEMPVATEEEVRAAVQAAQETRAAMAGRPRTNGPGC